jgi:hypothetical protein
VHGFVGPVGACSCLYACVMVSFSGPVVSFAEFPDCLKKCWIRRTAVAVASESREERVRTTDSQTCHGRHMSFG